MANLNPVRVRPPIRKAYYSKKRSPFLQRLFLIICSPLLLIIDAFRPRNSRKVVLAYLWFILIIMVITGLAYLANERTGARLEKMLGEFFYPGETPPAVSQEFREIINRYAVMFNMNPQLIMAVIKVESGFDPKARSQKGACGLMQITPLVWQYYNPESQCNGRHPPGRPEHGSDCIYAVEANIRTGVRYLRDLIDYFDGETGLAIEAYNAGLTNVDLERKKPKFRETRNYLLRIASVLTPLTNERVAGEFYRALLHRSFFKWMLVISHLSWMPLVVWVVKRLI